MTILTATNQRVQFYMTYTTDKPSTSAKYKRLATFKESLLDKGVMLDELFPAKQLEVLDRILYLTSGSGIAKVGADKLAEKCEVSQSTVYNTVKALKQTGQYIVARLIKTRGGAGKYIFVDKKHANFTEIMKDVFALSDAKIAEQFKEQDLTERHAAVSVEGNNRSSNLYIFSKQEKENYISHQKDNEVIRQVIEEQSELTRSYVEQYAVNKRQIAFYDLLNVMPYDNAIQSVRHLLALRIGSDCDDKRFVLAKDVIRNMAVRISEGYEFNNIVATFSAALKNALNYKETIIQASNPTYKAPVPFYDWLKERE